ncbi:MAG: dTDP-glucose 4,6-dehydratase [Planctomycetota bacterium]
MADSPRTILVTGGAGFIGSNLVEMLLQMSDVRVVNLDLLTYAGRLESLTGLMDHPRHTFVHGDIGDARLVSQLLREHQPDAVLHLAAESHVDRSIDTPNTFVQTNVLGTGVLLGCSLDYWEKLPATRRDAWRFIHVSTDEVFGSLEPEDPPFSEANPYAPNSPYAASKAGSDHLARSFWQTYGLPTIITNSSNNFGPRQFPEKLVPLMILRALSGKRLPIYGDGLQVRDWLFVEDQCRAILVVMDHGQPGRSYNVGAGCEKTNLEIVRRICHEAEEQAGVPAAETERLIEHVADRPGHDRRYAINASRVRSETGWAPRVSFEEGLQQTFAWYAGNEAWVASVTQGSGGLPTRHGLRGG